MNSIEFWLEILLSDVMSVHYNEWVMGSTYDDSKLIKLYDGLHGIVPWLCVIITSIGDRRNEDEKNERNERGRQKKRRQQQ